VDSDCHCEETGLNREDQKAALCRRFFAQ
jgi:hypothetical protein